MHISAPISHIDEIEALIAAGAHELYCGVVPPSWVAQFNTGAVNRRYFGNLPGLKELEKAIALAHAGGAKLFLVLNAQHYGGGQTGALVELARGFAASGGDAAIVADMTLIVALREQVPELAIHVSSVASCRNSAAVGFYRDLGVRRVILPRDVTIAEVEAMARAVPDVELEAFVLNDGCVFEEGVCHTVHLPSKLGGPICVDSYRFDYTGAGGRAVPPRVARRLHQHDEDYKRWLWYRFGCGFSTTDEGFPYGPCGLCAISRFAAAGLASVKIAGREGATERKIKSVEMVRRVLDKAAAGATEMAVRETAVGVRNTLPHCRSGFMCYYPEVRWPEAVGEKAGEGVGA
ncbi:MAG: U32 family peptidase [Rhodocyclales bacterium]|nr:U32 family peptidase [Rhodocyclales bacterium]